MAFEYGALDLSVLGNPKHSTNVPARSAALTDSGKDTVDTSRIDGPFIREADDATFNEVVELSLKVPIILDLWAQWCNPCKQLSPILEELAQEYAGKFQLVKVDVDKSPEIAQAFQAQSIPMLIAIIGGRPAPLFQGVQPKAQIKQIIDQVLTLATQNGITGRLSGGQTAVSKPVLPEQEEIQKLVESGDLTAALAKAEKAVRNQPQHIQVYQNLVDQINFAIRLSKNGAAAETPQAQADQLFATGNVAGAYQILLDLVASTAGEEREKNRLQLLEILRLGDDKELVNETRRKLAQLLF